MRRTHRSAVRSVTGALAGAAIMAGALVPWSGTVGVTAHAGVVSSSSYRLAPGVKLTKIRYGTPNQVRILTILPQSGPSLDVVPAGNAFPMYRLTSGMAASNNAVAGVNGDFATPYGGPSHATMIDGELWTSGSTGGQGVAFTESGANAYVGPPILQISARRFGKKAHKVAEWNVGKPSGNDMRGYTIRGGTAVRPPGTTSPKASDPKYCAVRLNPSAPYGWSGKARSAITRNYTVTAQPDSCKRTPLPLGAGKGNIVLATKGTTSGNATWIRRLHKGQTVKLSWGYGGWYGVTDFLGGSPMLVDNGKNVAPDYSPGDNNVYWYNPRTSVGVSHSCLDKDRTTKCKVWVLTVDGRQASSGWSKGMKLPGLASEFLKLGAAYAVNLDGGGSTTLWVHKRNSAYCESSPPVGGCLVNRPSPSTGERVTIEGLTVLAGRDPGTPRTLR
jgi:phosphodiester glycosidase